MAEFTQTDMKLAVGAVIFLIFINFAFPPLGLAGPETQRADIPEFNVTRGTFSFVKIAPDKPAAPSEGTLYYQHNVTVLEDNRRVWLEGDTSGGTELILLDDNTQDAKIILNHWSGGSVNADELILTNVSDVGDIDNSTENWQIKFTFTNRTNAGQSNLTLTVDYEVIQRPSDTGFLSSIPVVGGLFSAGSAVAGAVAWIGGILYTLVLNFIIASTNLALVVYNIISFFTGIGWWFLSTYNAVITNAPTTWAQLVLAIPGFTLSLLFGKLIIIGKQVIPILG